MPEDPKLTKLFDSLNKSLYKTNKLVSSIIMQEIISFSFRY